MSESDFAMVRGVTSVSYDCDCRGSVCCPRSDLCADSVIRCKMVASPAESLRHCGMRVPGSSLDGRRPLEIFLMGVALHYNLGWCRRDSSGFGHFCLRSDHAICSEMKLTESKTKLPSP